ncbi:MAG: WXG100 family type VII secretion target [Erysipelotrichaceae bacterium]|nr:WXG100 family type VII secretion target [Erysipelotrichaceae bacterium]
MSITIMVDPSLLEQCASNVEKQTLEYEKNYHQLYRLVEQMQNVWSGKDHLAYIHQIQNFSNDFVKMHHIMQQYISFLRFSANAYKSTQEERMLQAKRLIG